MKKIVTRLPAVIVPPELYQAVTNETITKDDTLKIVERDLKVNNIEPQDKRVLHMDKIAQDWVPYVEWLVDVNLKRCIGRWEYKISAFAREILQKRIL